MKRAVLLFGLIVMMGTSVVAQEPLTLDKAVGIALEQNRALAGARYGYESAHWSKLNAVTNFLPKVEIRSSYTRIDPETEARANASLDFIRASAGVLGIPPALLSNLKPFAYRDTYATDLTVVQPIYNGGAEILGVRAANAMEDQSEFLQQDTEQDVIARVRTSYYTVLKAQELVALAKESAERAQRYLDMTRRRASVGMRTQTDVLRWEVQHASAEGAVINAENMLAASMLQLNEVMGVELNRQFALQPIVTDSAGGPPTASLIAVDEKMPDPSGSDAAFLATHPAMRAAESGLRLADLNIDRSWVNFQPHVNLAFQYGWEKDNTLALNGIRPWALNLSVSFPVFNGFGDYTNLQKAHAEYRRTEMQVESAKRGLLMQATNARLALRAARKRTEIARKGQEEALDVLNSVSRRYETGGASNVDLIDVQTAYTSAKTDYITALYDYYIAEVQVARATGAVTR